MSGSIVVAPALMTSYSLCEMQRTSAVVNHNNDTSHSDVRVEAAPNMGSSQPPLALVNEDVAIRVRQGIR